MNCSHVTSRCVNSQQRSDDILRDLNLVTNGNIESCPATESCPVALGSKANSFFLLPLRSLQHLARRMFLRVDRSDHQRCTEGQPRLLKDQCCFFFVLACPIPGGRREVRTKMPGLDSNAIYSMRCSCSRKGFF